MPQYAVWCFASYFVVPLSTFLWQFASDRQCLCSKMFARLCVKLPHKSEGRSLIFCEAGKISPVARAFWSRWAHTVHCIMVSNNAYSRERSLHSRYYNRHSEFLYNPNGWQYCIVSFYIILLESRREFRVHIRSLKLLKIKNGWP